ncbi:Gfo/Idh/MocA family protein [Mycobacteroides chelonae]|jgi:predicted dehydrogenase|uniref:Oxidoreductase n=1 Tax=Mycobacteroides chelonae TaxID=1774 RepID=A0AB73MUN9_MYCCH|nr:Gfo/Idh/MocA family oxidoreductase [Mycobacteroides chelonae]MBF9327262.1 Gfo/Idh/MocA family oxidoreductase [Mycobacteroides chelonae]MBF9421439.1 Gfo/Idh/MocA family oxidoreductase [Mycobacteroides chelonae]MBF9436371.1 Gfo/Idh/MocA family oxidoreductase [Mycobacteroides chelonae]MBV6361348.1 Gfo/Idh/MocA family oxidoreductase [Mycobacteroides chelonae]MEC4904911.1 Gfo/Idh/MocA family oxidoreductase [Mycobacteroides chelonae]
MPDTIRWGIIGPGRIAGNVARDFPLTPGAELIAVASRSAERARDFAETHRIPRAFGSYRELLADPDVDAVYIATPHPQHRQAAIAALTAGKAILVEKAFTATVTGAQEIIDIARARGVFAMEAMWTRFQPAIVAAKNLVDDGAIGEVRQVQADLGVDRPFDPDDRLFSPTLGGGALLDLGVYVVSLAQYFLGDPAAVVAHGSLFPTGVDAEAGLLLRYDDGRTATLLCSLLHHTPGQARIFGTEGWIDILPRFHHPREIVLHRKGSGSEPIVKPPVGGGYSHELAEVTGCLFEGSAQSTVMPLADTLAVQRVLNTACEQLGVHHREDPADLD